MFRAHRVFRRVTQGNAPEVMTRNASATIAAPYAALDHLAALKVADVVLYFESFSIYINYLWKEYTVKQNKYTPSS